MLKLARRARGHFVTLIEIRVHLIRVKLGHISSFVVESCQTLRVHCFVSASKPMFLDSLLFGFGILLVTACFLRGLFTIAL